MKTSLYLTLVDHFRVPDVLHRARECRDAGWSVAWLTREEQPLYAPDTEISSWPELIGYRPDLVILDNLYFDDPNGQVITHLQGETPAVVTRLVLAKLLKQLEDAGTREAILVCEQERVSDAWRERLDRLGIPVLKADSDRCRYWRVIDPYGETYSYAEGRLKEDSEHRRKLEILFRTPAAETMLAAVCEYVTTAHEYDNPEDPCGTNRDKHWFNLERLVEELDESERFRLLDDVGSLYDLIEDVHAGAPAGGTGPGYRRFN